MTLNLPQGSVRFNFSQAAALALREALGNLMTQLKGGAAQSGEPGRPAPQPPMEYQHGGDIFWKSSVTPIFGPAL
ncbi:MAG: hypothetical protein HC922_04405, partial [Leptolyngbyaceae cyanobacterium SM2_3_12]|nr:hypothetical protein [Leptolyngbyaceae cyanobacterium SM2_3_12]